MRPAVPLVLILAFCAELRADWKDLRSGMDQRSAAQCVGFPLMQNRGRGGAEVWTYDHRGYIQFHRGRVTYWEASKPPVVVDLPRTATGSRAQAKTAAPAGRAKGATPG